MAGKGPHRSQQMVAIAAARTQRAAEAVQMAQRDLSEAEAMMRAAEAARDCALTAITEAQQLLAQSPGSEQHRLWLARCRDTHAELCALVEERQEQRAEAEMLFQQAMAAWRRQQLRQDHLTRHAASVSKQAERISERRIEDEQQGHGSAGHPTAMAL
jgi:hypothetical protein